MTAIAVSEAGFGTRHAPHQRRDTGMDGRHQRQHQAQQRRQRRRRTKEGGAIAAAPKQRAPTDRPGKDRNDGSGAALGRGLRVGVGVGHALGLGLLGLFLALAPGSVGGTNATDNPIISIGNIVTYDNCYSPLYNADSSVPVDRKVDRTEYIAFLNSLAEDFIGIDDYFAYAGGDFSLLPLRITLTFNYLSCSCKDYFPEEDRQDCCLLGNAHIATDGTAPGETPTDIQSEYLYNVCDESMAAIHDVVTAAPSSPPTMTPAPSERPSEPPSTSPSSPPTEAPSDPPSSPPTDPPTTPPSSAPTDPPSDSPTSSVVPTEAPSDPPTLAPVSGTPQPSASTQPSHPPTDAPSTTPTDAPSSAPSSPPTKTPAPTTSPSTAPSLVPTTTPSSPPSSSAPSSSPAPKNVPFTGEEDVVIEYGISNSAGLSDFDIIKNETIVNALGAAVDELADQVVANSNFRVRRRLGNVRVRVVQGGGMRRDDGPETGNRRRLSVDALSSELTALADVSCNAGSSSTDKCQYCESTITLDIVNEDKDAVVTTFSNNMEAAIANGGLNLNSLGLSVYSNPAKPTTTPPVGANIQSSNAGELTTGGQAGIGAAAGFIGLVAAVALFVTQRKKQRRREEKAAEDDNSLVSYNNGTSSEEDLLGPDGKSRNLSSAQKAGTLGASMPHYGSSNKNKTRGFATLDDDSSMGDSGSGVGSPNGHRDRGAPVPVHSPHSMIDDSVESSSNAGSSGWSSSAGVSSLNTASVDSIEFGPGLSRGGPDARGSSLAAIGVASGMTNRMVGSKSGSGLQFVPVTRDTTSLGDSTLDSNPADLLNNSASDPNSVPTLPTVSRADLDQAIEAGDWAAVGATAALLASASDSQSNASSLKSRSTYRSRGASTVSSIDAARANELDHLVDSGDWEGVVLAAAKFEASSVDGGSKSMGSASHSTSDPKSTLTDGTSDPSKSTTTRSMGDSSAFSPSVATSVSESPSKAQKRAEIRTEVEALVRRVVPDEIDNVDEMMLQFNGREEELVETLRTMQERSIAQRARAAVHRSAKREARRSRASGSGFPPPVPPRPPTAAAARPSTSAPSKDSGGGGGGLGTGAAAAIGVGAAAAAGGAVALAQNAAKKKEDNSGDNNETVRGNASITTGSMPPANKPLHPEGSLAPLALGSGSPGQNKSDEHTEFSDPQFTGIKDSSDKQLSTSSGGLPPLGGTKENSSRGSGSNSGSGKDRSMSARRSRDYLSSGPDTSESEYTGDRSSTLGGMSSGMSSNNQRHKSALELAIEAGDWEAVGEAAAMMSDASITTASTAEINALANAPDYDTDDSRHSGGYVSPGGVNAERAAELDKMIDRGDWTGVVAAATRFSNSDKAKMGSVRSGLTSGSSGSGILKPLSSSVGRGRPAPAPPTKDRALQEEEDALAQAEIWMAIAAQSKQEGSTEAKGASDAADWAISRSLSAMKNAEEKGALANKGGSGKNNRKLMSSVESVGGGSSKGDKSV